MPEITFRVRSRGLGIDFCDTGCFICGLNGIDYDRAIAGYNALHNFAAFCAVEDQEGILMLFDRGVRMAYYHGDKKVPQVKVQACGRHLPQLTWLSEQHYFGLSAISRLVKGARTLDARDAVDVMQQAWDTWLTGAKIPWPEYWERRRAKEDG